MDNQQRRIRTRGMQPNREFTLMTVLAYDEDSKKLAQDLLKKHGLQPSEIKQEIEKQLADLYIKTTDKVGLEKQLAEIHPHAKWILKRLTPDKQIQTEITEKASNADGKENKETQNIKPNETLQCPFLNNQYAGFCGADGLNTLSIPSNNNNKISNIELIALVAVIGLTFYLIKK